MRGLRAGEASGSRSPSCACSGLGEGEVEGWKLYLPGSPAARLGRRGDGAGGVAQRLRSLGTLRKPPSLSERLQRLQRLGAQRAARTQPTGAWSSAPFFPNPSNSRNASGGPGTAHRPARGAERDWPDTRCQVAKQRSEPRAELREGGGLEVDGRSGRALKAAARRSAWKCGGELGLLPKSK